MRKANLQRLLARRPDGIFISQFEQGEIGPDLFVAACRMGLEGLSVQAPRPTLPRRPAKALAQGEEPRASCICSRAGSS
jgi:bifunctional non-homologous end joining protein LigD